VAWVGRRLLGAQAALRGLQHVKRDAQPHVVPVAERRRDSPTRDSGVVFRIVLKDRLAENGQACVPPGDEHALTAPGHLDSVFKTR